MRGSKAINFAKIAILPIVRNSQAGNEMKTDGLDLIVGFVSLLYSAAELEIQM